MNAKHHNELLFAAFLTIAYIAGSVMGYVLSMFLGQCS
jgi:hypothetical protein